MDAQALCKQSLEGLQETKRQLKARHHTNLEPWLLIARDQQEDCRGVMAQELGHQAGQDRSQQALDIYAWNLCFSTPGQTSW